MLEKQEVPFKAFSNESTFTATKAKAISKKIIDDKPWTTNFNIQRLKHELATFELEGKRTYYEQAQYLMYRIPVYKPVPIYKITWDHLDKRMQHELEGLDKITLRFVLRQAVGRIFEDIDCSYYHTSISKLLEVNFQ
jgi:hypothetical protein